MREIPASQLREGILRMLSDKNKLRTLLLSDDLDIRHKLQNILITISMAGCAASVVISFATQMSLAGNLASLLGLLTLSLAFYLSVIRKKKEAAYYLITIAVNLVLFPLMYMLNGGVYSGMPLWLAFGLVFPWFAMDGARCCVMFALDLIAALGCLAVQMFFPELILLPEGDLTKMAVLDVAQVMVTVPVMIGLTVKYQSVVFKRQQRKMEQQEKKLLEAMRTADRANEAKTSFLASMSHEIRTPINAVLGMDEMILRESSDESILSYAANIQSAGHSLLSVINDILDLSKIESGRLELLTAEYSTQQLMNDCYSMMIMRAEKKDLLLEIKNDPQLPAKLAGDEVRLRQVILNLLTNAVKYTSAGEVTMRVDFKHTAENEIMLKISVRDTGMGISQENQQNLFKAFRRLDEMTNRHIEGTGLGLNITKHLTEMMGGTIAVRSTLGSGSEFTVEIPQRVVSYEPVGVFIENRRAASGQKEEYHERFRAPGARILVVDDVKLNIDVIKGLLRLTQIRTESAYSGRECLGLVSRTHYDLIFMDHLMPDMDGIETLKQLRAQDGSPNAGTPVIALTANVMVGAREKYAACGFTDYLAKPVQSDRLESVLLEYLPRELILPITPGSETHEAASGARELPELNAAAGINCCCGDEKLFRRIIGMADMTSRAESLEKALDNSDWKEYAQTCTELCSAAAAVGAERLAQSAQYSADLLAAGNIAELRSHERRLISHCKSFDEAAAAYIQKYTENGEKY